MITGHLIFRKLWKSDRYLIANLWSLFCLLRGARLGPLQLDTRGSDECITCVHEAGLTCSMSFQSSSVWVSIARPTRSCGGRVVNIPLRRYLSSGAHGELNCIAIFRDQPIFWIFCSSSTSISCAGAYVLSELREADPCTSCAHIFTPLPSKNPTSLRGCIASSEPGNDIQTDHNQFQTVTPIPEYVHQHCLFTEGGP